MSRIVFVAFGSLCALAGLAQALDVTSCPVTVPAREFARLQNDIACSTGEPNHPYSAIKLERGASLDLQGHTITFTPGSAFVAVECAERCALGFGTITTTGGGIGISTVERARVFARDVAITGFGTGIQSAVGKVVLENVTIDATTFGVTPVKKIQVLNVNVSLSAAAYTNECLGASQPGGRVKGRQVVLTGCGTGVLANRITLEDVTATGSKFGVFGGHVRLRDSSITGSLYYDVVSGKMPRLVSTTCDTSGHPTGGGFEPWGVCTND